MNERVAAHLRLTLPGGDPWVVSVLRTSGVRALARGEALDAAVLLERALGEPCTAADRSSLLVALSQAYAGSAAPQAFERSAEWEDAIDDPRERARALQAMSRLLFSRGEARAAVQVAERGRKALAATDQLAGRILASQVACMFFVPGAWPETERLLDELEDGLEPALATGAAAVGAARHPPWGLGRRERGACAPAGAGDAGGAAGCRRGLAGRPEHGGGARLRRRIRARRTDAAAHGRARSPHRLAGVRGDDRALARELRYHQGWIADAVLDTRQAIDNAVLGWTSETAWSASVLAVARVELADLEGARDAIAIGMAGDHSSLPHGFLLHAGGEVALAMGDPETALEHFTDAGTHLSEHYCLANPAVVPWRTGAATALVALGERARARALAELALAEARKTEVPLAVGGALRAAAAASRSGQRIELLREAVAVLGPSGAELEHMRALCDLGAALRHARQTRGAGEMLDRAVVLARQRGATATARRALRELRLSGSRPSRGPYDQQATRLTPGERRVAELAAQDLSNARIAQRLFITLRTVESHLTQTYRKLGIRSRAGLARALIEIDDIAILDG